MNHHLTRAIAPVALAAMAAIPAQAENLRTASAFGASHIQATAVFATFNEKLEELTEGRFTGQDFPSGLAGPNEMITALRDGVVDAGTVMMPYFPADFPEANLPGDLSIIGSNPVAISNATTEYLVTCEECQAEYRALGQVYLGTGWTASYQLQTVDPILDPSDLAGYRLRTSGLLYSGWAEFMGAEPVQFPSSELFEAMNQGLVDGYILPIGDMVMQQLEGIINDVTIVNLGLFNGDSLSLRSGIWDELSIEDKQAFVDAAMWGREASSTAWHAKTDEAIAIAEEEEIEFHEPNEAFAAALEEFREQHLANYVNVLEERGVENGQAKIDRYVALVEKWEGLMEEVGRDPEAIFQLKMDEIWSKVDMATYGT